MINQRQPDPPLEVLRSGDRQAFASLVEAYSGQIFRLAMKMLNNAQDAEDVLQNTFIKALQNIHAFEGRSSIMTWLYRIATNEALMVLRKQRPEVQESDTATDDDEDGGITPHEFADWGSLPEQTLLEAEAKRELDRAVHRLPETLRIVFLLRDIEKLSIQETSQILGLTETAVKTRLLRARLRLREELAHYYGERMNQE